MSLTDVVGRHEAVPIGGGDICRSYRLQGEAGVFFAKTPRSRDPHMFAVEARGLEQLGDVVAGLTPAVVHHDEEWLVLEWIDDLGPSVDRAYGLGRRLAHLHQASAPPFGHGPAHGRIGSLPMPGGEFDTWAQMYARVRLLPLADAGLPNCLALADALVDTPDWAGPPEASSLLHGDLWSGNVLWSDPPRVIDPACHSGHRETDLAMLALFGTPCLEQTLVAYQEVYPLSEGWQRRVALHQLWPLLVHHRLFGGGYGARAEQIAAGYLR